MKGSATMIEAFPFFLPKPVLEYEDFTTFARAFRKVVQAAIPGCGSIYITDGAVPESFHDQAGKYQCIALALDEIFLNGASVSVVEEGLLFSFSVQGDSSIVFIVDGVDPLIIQRAAEDWLLETREQLALKFLECKQSFTDPETGLLNNVHLFGELNSLGRESSYSIVLVKIPARNQGLRETFRNAQRAASALKYFCDNRFLLHHLGQNIYALLTDSEKMADVESFSSSLVHYLKRENFYRVHIGSSQFPAEDVSGDDAKLYNLRDDNEPGLLDEAWTALHEAARRGPFSFCDFSLLVNADKHPLRNHRGDILRRFRRAKSRGDKFCIIKLSLPESDTSTDVSARLQAVLECLELPEGVMLRFLGLDRGSIIFASGADRDGGLVLAQKIIAELQGIKEFSNLYAGVSCYPYLDFSSAEALQNAHKALLHAEFFGSGHSVLFDAVSLNISGDIYFGDGNLPKAIKEYKLGLRCDPEDVNLLNSLGVTYALMNRNNLARKTFTRVLEVDCENYMAHYNLGLGAQQKNDAVTALHHFTVAHSLCEKAGQQQDICCDLRLQLGKLCCRAKEYKQSVQYLTLWMDSMPESEQSRASRYLGEAYLGAGEPQRALPILQKALSQNPFDAEIMSMLGEAVWLAKEGAEIALSFCRKAVELEPQDSVLRLRLAKVQYHVGESESSLASLKKCRGASVNPVEVQLLKAMAYADLNQKLRARSWAEKVVGRGDDGGELYKKADLLIASL
ncbi:tetratricopeptide repeat protein [Desulfosediminicola ganghwensis]|uniref:tetratricopeptide repeat protein n=1 Tax=Desulfosediminicola ganghwensis TaxID=2569540 RepID=UPI0010AC46D5|nr:tetratricopeptide repeat protein [Desulfosediminicola ganghwensis]